MISIFFKEPSNSSVVVNAFIVLSPLGKDEFSSDNLLKSFHSQFTKSSPNAIKHFPFSNFTESKASKPSTFDSNGTFKPYDLVPCISITTAKLFDSISIGFENSNVW